jgi:carboxymethylenebutenolidase
MAESVSSATEHVGYPSRGLTVNAEVAKPGAAGRWPAVILIHEITGTSDHYRDVANRFAREGYLALVPDLYSNDAVFKGMHLHDIHQVGRFRHAKDLDKAVEVLPEDQREGAKKAVYWDRERDTSTYVPDLLSAIEYLQSRPDVLGGAIGCIGYCWGGGELGKLLVAGADLAAASIYYGEPPDLDKLSNIRCPVQGHYGGADTVVGSAFVPELSSRMQSSGKEFESFIYDEAPHAFFNDTGPRYRAEAANLAWQRTLQFFEKHLKRASSGAR